MIINAFLNSKKSLVKSLNINIGFFSNSFILLSKSLLKEVISLFIKFIVVVFSFIILLFSLKKIFVFSFIISDILLDSFIIVSFQDVILFKS